MATKESREMLERTKGRMCGLKVKEWRNISKKKVREGEEKKV